MSCDYGGHEVAARSHRRRAEVEPLWLKTTAFLARNHESRAPQGRARGVVGDVGLSSELDGAAREAKQKAHWHTGDGAQGVHKPKAARLTALLIGRGRHEREAAAAAARQSHVLLRPAETNALFVLVALARPLQLHGQRFAAVHGLRGRRPQLQLAAADNPGWGRPAGRTDRLGDAADDDPGLVLPVNFLNSPAGQSVVRHLERALLTVRVDVKAFCVRAVGTHIGRTGALFWAER